MRPIYYPADFITRVKKTLPAVPYLHAHLDSGSIWVGNDLREIRDRGLPIESVWRVTKSNEYVHLKDAAKMALSNRRQIQALLQEWRKLLLGPKGQ